MRMTVVFVLVALVWVLRCRELLLLLAGIEILAVALLLVASARVHHVLHPVLHFVRHLVCRRGRFFVCQNNSEVGTEVAAAAGIAGEGSIAAGVLGSRGGDTVAGEQEERDLRWPSQDFGCWLGCCASAAVKQIRIRRRCW